LREQLSTFIKPSYFQIDDRKTEDFILFTIQLAEKIKYYNFENKVDGNWKELLSMDEAVILAQISKFDLSFYDKKRIKLIQQFDEQAIESDKIEIFKSFYHILYDFFDQINVWYSLAVKNNLEQQSSQLESELESLIQIQSKLSFGKFASYYLALKNGTDPSLVEGISLDDFLPIWQTQKLQPIDIFEDIDDSKDHFSSGLKKLMLLYNPVFDAIFRLQIKARDIFYNTLHHKDDHNAHLGLLFAFFELYRHVQLDLNSLTEKHLNHYFKIILQQNPKPKQSKQRFFVFHIDENIKSLTAPKGTEIVSGQYENGEDVIFETEHESTFINSQICELRTLFVSKNNAVEFYSGQELVSGIYAKTHFSTADELEEFNSNANTISTFGEEQLFKSDNDVTMDVATFGFAISTSCFLIDVSERTIKFSFHFSPDSIKHISGMIIEISNALDIKEEEIFNKIFQKAFLISYTSEEGWVDVQSYKVLYPTDWSTGVIELRLELTKRDPAIRPYSDTVHDDYYATSAPIFRFILSDDTFYFPFSFFSELMLTKLDVDVDVRQLKNLLASNENGSIDLTSEFPLFGLTPKNNSYLLIGSNELFCKKISDFDIGWDYSNFPTDDFSLSEHYANYNHEVSSDNFKLKVSALSDFSYTRKGSIEPTMNFFEERDNVLLPSILLQNIDAEGFKLRVKNGLLFEDLQPDKVDAETGYIKLEYKPIKEGFGHQNYNALMTQLMLNSKKGRAELNTPYSPSIKNLYLNYRAKCEFNFTQGALSNQVSGDDSGFFHISAEGISQTYSSKFINSKNLVPRLNFDGELIIGFDQITTPQRMSILFEINKSKNDNYEFSPNVDWYYSSSSGWKLLNESFIISDETYSLLKTGVIQFKVPDDISNADILFNNDRYYLKACSKTKADQFSLIKSIHNNAVLASEKLNSNEDLTVSYSKTNDLKRHISGVVNISQPLRTFGGKKDEEPDEFYNRISHLLAHKNRPVTKWEIEKFVLSQFDWLSHVKCFSVDNDRNADSTIKIMCLKKIVQDQNIEETKLNVAEMFEIKAVISKFISPFSSIEIINPIFEDLWVKCNIKFLNMASGRAIETFNQDFLNFVCPWLDNPSTGIKPNFNLTVSSIKKFIASRPYVNAVSGLSVIHIKLGPDGLLSSFDSANSKINTIVPGMPWSIIVPRNNHIIQPMTTIEYNAPDSVNYEKLIVEDTFFIDGDDQEETLGQNLNPSTQDSDDNSFILNIKL
jgi:hypothetical protein